MATLLDPATRQLTHGPIDGCGSILASYGGGRISVELAHSKITNDLLPSQIEGERGTIQIDHLSTPRNVRIDYRGDVVRGSATEAPREQGDNGRVLSGGSMGSGFNPASIMYPRVLGSNGASYGDDGSIHFRHARAANLGWVDGHATVENLSHGFLGSSETHKSLLIGFFGTKDEDFYRTDGLREYREVPKQ